MYYYKEDTPTGILRPPSLFIAHKGKRQWQKTSDPETASISSAAG
jgi:hypothetical protein